MIRWLRVRGRERLALPVHSRRDNIRSRRPPPPTACRSMQQLQSLNGRLPLGYAQGHSRPVRHVRHDLNHSRSDVDPMHGCMACRCGWPERGEGQSEAILPSIHCMEPTGQKTATTLAASTIKAHPTDFRVRHLHSLSLHAAVVRDP